MADGFRPSRLSSALIDLVLLLATLVLGLAGLAMTALLLPAGASIVWWIATRRSQLAAIWANDKAKAVITTIFSIALIGAVHAGLFLVGAYIHERFGG